MTYGTHLRRSRHGTLYFRYVIPADVRSCIGRSELSVSLGASSRRDAQMAALELELIAKRLVAATRAGVRMNEADALKLIALHHNVTARQLSVLQREVGESDATLATKSAEVDQLKAKLIAMLDVPRAAVIELASPTLSHAIATFKGERSATGAWTDKTAGMWDSRLRLLLEWFGDVPVSDLSREGMTGFLTALQKLPKNASKYKALHGLSMRGLVALEGVDRIAPSTVNQIMECMSALFAWMDTDRAKWKVSGNIARGLTLSNVTGVKRVAFSADDLRAMFTSPEWVAQKFLHSYGYWLLPLGLFTGARINELCQIELKDFGEDHGHPVISVCTEGLRGKNKNARRTVPVHPELVRLGLLRHVGRLRHAGGTKLFPECVEKRDGHGQDASRWFGKFKTRAGIVDPRKVFHSARHGFITQLLTAKVDRITCIAPLVGHAGTGATVRSYWNEKDIGQFVAAVSIVVHPVVTELVPVVEDVEFGVDKHRSLRRPPIRQSAPVPKRTKRAVGS